MVDSIRQPQPGLKAEPRKNFTGLTGFFRIYRINSEEFLVLILLILSISVLAAKPGLVEFPGARDVQHVEVRADFGGELREWGRPLGEAGGGGLGGLFAPGTQAR